METVNANAALLSNYEVLHLLQEIRNKQKRSAKTQVATVTFEAIQYLQESPCADQSPEKMKQLLIAYKSFNLTKAEKLMLINNPPQKEVDVHLMVEESGERLTDDQIQEIINVSSDQTLDIAE